MNPLQFGVFLSPPAADFGGLRDKVLAAEAAGFDYVSIQDHPYVPGHLDCLAVIGVLIGTTSRVRFMTNVVNLPLRPPVMLAKAAASLDLMSGGRFELGLGGGARWQEIAALGEPVRTPGQVYDTVDEAMSVVRTVWAADRDVTFEGRHYRTSGSVGGPVPERRIGVWLGVAGPRMLTLLGRRADGWIAPIRTPFETKLPAQDRIDAAARAAGRQPGDVRRVIQLVGTVTDQRAMRTRPRNGPGTQPIRATPDDWATILTEFAVAERFDTISFLPETENVEQIQRFAAEVIPATRERVG